MAMHPTSAVVASKIANGMVASDMIVPFVVSVLAFSLEALPLQTSDEIRRIPSLSDTR